MTIWDYILAGFTVLGMATFAVLIGLFLLIWKWMEEEKAFRVRQLAADEDFYEAARREAELLIKLYDGDDTQPCTV